MEYKQKFPSRYFRPTIAIFQAAAAAAAATKKYLHIIFYGWMVHQLNFRIDLHIYRLVEKKKKKKKKKKEKMVLKLVVWTCPPGVWPAMVESIQK